MKNDRKKAAEVADKILKEMTTPEERGFVCMYPDNCEICIKAAVVGETTTACEDELIDERYKEKTKNLDGKFALGIYTTPHIEMIDLCNSTQQSNPNKKIWRAWIRLHEGGIIGIPFPAKNERIAKVRAFRASIVFYGDLLELEDLGSLDLKP